MEEKESKMEERERERAWFEFGMRLWASEIEPSDSGPGEANALPLHAFSTI